MSKYLDPRVIEAVKPEAQRIAVRISADILGVGRIHRPPGMSSLVWSMVQQKAVVQRDLKQQTETLAREKEEFAILAKTCDARAMGVSQLEADLEEINRWLAANGVAGA